jgi:hypothetical protein
MTHPTSQNTLTSRRDSADAQADLLATLAAGRELGPEMDTALVESYLQRHHIAAGARSATHAESRRSRRMPVGIAFVVGVMVVSVVLLAAIGHVFWLLWLPIAMGWWFFGWSPYGRQSRRFAHDPCEERDARPS